MSSLRQTVQSMSTHAEASPQLELPGLITRVEFCFFRDLVKTDGNAYDYETDMKEKATLKSLSLGAKDSQV